TIVCCYPRKSFAMSVTSMPEFFEDELISSKFFHGLASHEDIRPLLANDGDYLLRLSYYEGRPVYVLSVFVARKIRNFILNQDSSNHKFYFNAYQEISIKRLIERHHKTSISLSANAPILKNAIPIPEWNFSAQSVMPTRKISNCYWEEAIQAEIEVRRNKFPAAVMMLNENADMESVKSFLAEARLLRKLNHPNILRSYGIIVTAKPVAMLLELCQTNLARILREKKFGITPLMKLRFANEAASALAYLEGNKLVHKNVAARNCLVDGNLSLKFGNLRDATLTKCPSYLHSDPIHKVNVRWMAPETMQQHIFSTKSDVWAYGVLLWEIYADGAEPYPGLTNLQICALVTLKDYRMDPLKTMPMTIWSVVTNCWRRVADQRPSFRELNQYMWNIRQRELRSRGAVVL
uniref:Tyrosine-protein kinase n=1 Tax=Parascaris univalens TaxID=6257 RepID=A0A914ZMM7_PARUN